MRVEGDGTAGGRSATEARFNQLYARFYSPIRAYCNRRVRADAVDDVTAETFLTMWRRIDKVPEGDAALPWLYGVAYRVIEHQWRGVTRLSRLRSRLQAAESRTVTGADDGGFDAVESRRVLAALARLSETDAEVLRLDAWEQLSAVSIAVVLGIEPHAVRQRLHRARRKLAREYDGLLAPPTSACVAPLGGAQ
jgi:RNA polymerase sigma-70 factor (ECF subfamily)